MRRYVSERHISVELGAEILAWIKQRRPSQTSSAEKVAAALVYFAEIFGALGTGSSGPASAHPPHGRRGKANSKTVFGDIKALESLAAAVRAVPQCQDR